MFSNRFLRAGMAVAAAFAMALVCLPAVHCLFCTAALTPAQLATVAPFPFIVWGADEVRRLLVRRHRARRQWLPTGGSLARVADASLQPGRSCGIGRR